jgi:hypothetical protein
MIFGILKLLSLHGTRQELPTLGWQQERGKLFYSTKCVPSSKHLVC